MIEWMRRATTPDLGIGEAIGPRWFTQAQGNLALLHQGQAPMSTAVRGVLRGSTGELIAKFLEADPSGLIVEQIFSSDDLDSPSTAVLAFDTGVIYLSHCTLGSTIYLNIANSDKNLLRKLAAIANSVIGDAPAGQIYVVLQTPNGLALQSIGSGKVLLEEANYSADVVADFLHVVEDINSAKPCGRLSVIDGVPGTGKTYLIRALAGLCPNAIFFILPAELVPHISGPGLLKVLIDTRANNENTPMVMIIEDADACLVRRAADNVSAISTILNMGDGILGDLLDLRIVCTTNAGHLNDRHNEMDPAITRSGRLCKRISVGKLSRRQANQRWAELMSAGPAHADALEGKGPFTEDTNIADVYKAAKHGNVFEAEKPRLSMGFVAPSAPPPMNKDTNGPNVSMPYGGPNKLPETNS